MASSGLRWSGSRASSLWNGSIHQATGSLGEWNQPAGTVTRLLGEEILTPNPVSDKRYGGVPDTVAMNILEAGIASSTRLACEA